MSTRARSKKQREERLVEKIHQMMAIGGQAGLVAKVCMLAGLNESEALYCFNQEICDNSPGCCSCHKLHIINKRNGLTVVVINWSRRNGRRIYFAMMPTVLWERFRGLTTLNEADIQAMNKILKKAGIGLSCLARIFYTVMKTTMDDSQIDVLVGKANPCIARCLLFSDLKDLISSYLDGWQQVGLVLPVL
jgi:hypothetical protein